MKKVIIGSRGSKLALWQAHRVRDALGELRPGLEIEVLVIKTEGDARHDLSPGAFGREGIFTAELDRALFDHRVDVAVHSLKDLPTKLGQGLCLAAATERASVRDLFILSTKRAREIGAGPGEASMDILADLPSGLVVGTSSLRRIAQLKHRFPALDFAPMRGNLDTRMRKLDEGEVDAIVVAEAGLMRLEIPLGEHPFVPLLADWYLPAAGQGSLALETRDEGRERELAALLDHPETRAAVTAERAAMSALGAGCRVPAGFLGRVFGGAMAVRGVVGSPEGDALIMAETSGFSDDAAKLGELLARDLLDRGAGEILKEVRG